MAVLDFLQSNVSGNALSEIFAQNRPSHFLAPIPESVQLGVSNVFFFFLDSECVGGVLMSKYTKLSYL